MLRKLVIGAAAVMLCAGRPPAARAADGEGSITVAPMREAIVDGDREKFRAHHWMNDGYAGGLKDAHGRYTFDDGTELTAEGHALAGANDFGADVALRKTDLGFTRFDFSEFRKYYDGSGGVYNPFAMFQVVESERELQMDIGRLGVETGLTLEGWPELSFLYERDYKDGTKSRLNWTPVTEAANAKNIGPSWQDVEETTDNFALKASHELAGVALKGEQRWEFTRSELFREERSFSTNTTAATGSERKIRRQDQAPETRLMTTTLDAERGFWDDKARVAGAYRFAHMKNREFESLLEFNENGVLTAFSNPKMQVNARADNDYDSHTWVTSSSVTPWEDLSFTTKLKAEVIKKESNSTYPGDTGEATANGGTPDGVIDRFDNSLTNMRAVRWGEAYALRYSGIPRTALYSELELEQGRVLLREDRVSLDGPDTGNGVSTGEIFNRETVTGVQRAAWTLGGRVAPLAWLDLTTHVRRRINHNDYDDQRESVAANTALSAFVDNQETHTNEFATRLTVRPCRWFRSSARYQLRDESYFTRFEAQDSMKAKMLSHTYTYEMTVQPLPALTATTSYSWQTAATSTAARLNGTVTVPAFNANVNTWLVSADYSPVSRLTLTSALQLSRARNFNDFSATGLPLGADFTQIDTSAGARWAVTDASSVGLEYAFYRYDANDNAEAGDYDAHVIWLEATQTF